MPYLLDTTIANLEQPKKFANTGGNTECVEFVRQACRAPKTTLWIKGESVMAASPGTIQRGTAIATFDEDGRYPTDTKGKHAAVYLSHGPNGIRVLDQWNSQGAVKERTIYDKKPGIPRVNSAKNYFVIE
jgi:hypothetical protein